MGSPHSVPITWLWLNPGGMDGGPKPGRQRAVGGLGLKTLTGAGSQQEAEAHSGWGDAEWCHTRAANGVRAALRDRGWPRPGDAGGGAAGHSGTIAHSEYVQLCQPREGALSGLMGKRPQVCCFCEQSKGQDFSYILGKKSQI